MDLTSIPVRVPLTMGAWTLKESTISGSIWGLIPARATSSSSQFPLRLHMKVLLALEASVRYFPVR